MFLNLEEKKILFEKPFCTICEKKILAYFKEQYLSELRLFHKNIDYLTKQFRKNEKKKFQNALNFLLALSEGTKINGRKRICWNLIDIFLVLEAPIDYIILTTNIRHLEPFAKCIDKLISRIN